MPRHNYRPAPIQKPADEAAARASPLAPRPIPVASPKSPLHDRIDSAIKMAERAGHQTEAATLNNVLVSLQDARYKAQSGMVQSGPAAALIAEIMAL